MPSLLDFRIRRRLAAVPLALALAACGLAGGADENATAEDVDQESPASVTEEEQTAFQAPADSVLSPEQVERYLRTSLLQFDLVRKEAGALHDKAKGMEERAKDGGVIAGLRNVVDAGSLVTGWADLVGGSYVRSARSLGYNPAELEWVRERMTEVSGQAMQNEMRKQAAAGAEGMRKQAEELRRQFKAGELQGMTEAQVEDQAKQMEAVAASLVGEGAAAGAVAANMEVLRRARSGVSDEMWLAIGMAGGATGLAAWGGLGDPADPELQKKMDEIRALYQAALDNKPVGGASAAPAAAGEQK